jgi:hypothetical protein
MAAFWPTGLAMARSGQLSPAIRVRIQCCESSHQDDDGGEIDRFVTSRSLSRRGVAVPVMTAKGPIPRPSTASRQILLSFVHPRRGLWNDLRANSGPSWGLELSLL